ncbi:sulfatase [Bacillus sp. FJAT-50079]|uniref:sulfatase family protein n=1 Tax=Bacillus sp. FJAT-50079 TaxID=2833577 RepID=UPI001BCA5D0A|nr:sulfatase [Bacillus sp. FJAT-50079]
MSPITELKKHNIVYIHTHDSGKIFSPYGYAVNTPHIEALANESLLFRQAFAASPTCSPSRSAMLTGMYPHSCEMLGLANRGFSIADYDWHIVSNLKKHGYKTALCGIQHEAGHYLDHEAGAEIIGYDEDITSSKNIKSYQQPYSWDYENALNVSEWLRSRNSEQPFFLSFGMYSAHREYPVANHDIVNPDRVMPPHPIPDNSTTREDYARHLISIGHADHCVGLVINALKETGLYENSIIIFTTDHGIAFPFSKCNLYDAGIGVALMMRVPSSKANGLTMDNLISQIDLYPTLCELVGIEKADRLQGESFARYFYDEMDPHRNKIFAEINFHTSYEPARCIRTERYKYIRYFDHEYLKINISNINESPTKKLFMANQLENRVKEPEALYDLLYDSGERNNLIGDPNYSRIIDYFRNEMNEWQLDTNDPLIKGPIRRKKEWKVNKKTSVVPSSKNRDDYEVYNE